MAGNYNDVPGQRMAYDRDGTVCVYVNGTSATQQAQSLMVTMNDHGTTGWNFPDEGNLQGVLIFPEKRDIVGVHQAVEYGGSSGWNTYYGFKTSVDTTNGIDGTWVTQASPTTGIGNRESMRENITPYNLTGIKAVKWHWAGSWYGAGQYFRIKPHLYGGPTSGEAPNRLRFWHPTLDQEVDGAYFDWGDIPRSTTVDKDFRIKNPSATLTAETVGLTMEALTDTTPSNVGQHSFTTDGVTFASSVNLGDLAPGVISPVVTLRRVTVADAVFSLWWTRIVASASAWV